jgi:hypothetical protein
MNTLKILRLIPPILTCALNCIPQVIIKAVRPIDYK